MSECWVQTWSGVRFDILEPSAEMVVWKDIAYSLARQCRFNGHTSRFYSVAHHCVLASKFVDGSDERYALYALLHDAAEAYIGDLPAPVKCLLPEFKRIEYGILRAVYAKAGIPAEEQLCEADRANVVSAVTRVDLRLLLTERNQLMDAPPEPWPADEWCLEPVDVVIHPEPDFEVYEGRFLRRLKELGVEIEG